MVIQARAQLTRGTILAGAAAVFRRRGYGSASIADIATESGTTKGALYFHFRSKDKLARAVIDEQHQRTMAASAEVLAQGRPGLETLVRLSAVLARQILDDPIVDAGIQLTTDAATFDHPVFLPYKDWLDTAEELFARAIAEGDVRPDLDPAVVARFLIPAYTGVQLVSGTLSDRSDLLQRVRELWLVLLPGIVAPERLDALRTLPDLVADAERPAAALPRAATGRLPPDGPLDR